jgi:hypothetical protein
MRSREFIWAKYRVPLFFYKEVKARGKAFRKIEQQRKNKSK